MKKNILFSLFLSFSLALLGQTPETTWKFEQKKADNGTIDIVATANIPANWYMYSSQPVNGPLPTAFEFKKSENYELVEGIKDVVKPKEKYDDAFEINVKIFENTAIFLQKIKPLTDKFVLSGAISYQTCSGSVCLFNETEFSLQITNEQPTTNTENQAVTDNAATSAEGQEVIASVGPNEIKAAKTDTKKESILGFILAAIAAGLACILTPCVFPMIPMNISFFMSGSKNKAQTVGKAFIFWLSVGFVYGLVGCIIAIFKSDSFAQMISSHWIPNLIFALMFIAFTASFFGMFEISLPSGMANKADKQVDKGGYLASFFLAIVMAVVSFSCTGPFMGSLIYAAAQGSAVAKPIFGFICFGLAMASPFLIFATFPSLMQKMPKSGGWLNSVKVIFAFILLGFSLKFLVQIENYFNWNIISREVAIGFWISLAIMMGIYILGKIKFAHDSDVSHISFFRLLLAVCSFTFAAYLVPGLFGADLEAVSAFIPSKEKQSFDLGAMRTTSITTGNYGSALLSPCGQIPKYAGFDSRMALPDNIPGYFDLEEAKECAKNLQKPILLDFTGIFCSNCKKMKAGAFKDPRVIDLINSEFIMVALYVDVKTVELPIEEQTTNSKGKIMKTIGEWNANYQSQKFEVRSQPYFAIIDADENIMAKDLGYANADELLKFLNEGLAAFREK